MDNFEKIKVIGQGAYGKVHLCLKLSDKKHVIIKEIPVEQMTKDERLAALNEVKVLAMLDHPNIIEYYENFLEDKAIMIVMEYAQGGTLFEYLQQRKGNLLDEAEVLRIFAQLLLSLQHVHSKQILHRDLKTQNILLDKSKEIIKISDFGISKVLSSKSKAYSVVGTPCYISPELCEGKPYNQKSDIWALGCVLYELCTLKRAFEAITLPALILKIMRGSFAPIAEHYSQDLRMLILSMLHLDPNKRPTINQIMAQPILISPLMNLFTEIGKLPCKRVQRPISNLPASNRRRPSRTGSASTTHSGKGTGSLVSIVMEPHSTTIPKPATISSVYSWGRGVNTPTKLPLPSSDTMVTEVSMGPTQRAAVTKNGRLFVWESPGVGTESMIPGSMDGGQQSFIPRFLEGQSAVTIQHVSCGHLFTACLTDRGILMTFGSGATGCLGHGNNNDVSQAKIVEDLLGYEVIQVSCGTSHVLAVTNEHEVFSWGRGDNGRLGLGSQESICSPKLVEIPGTYRPCSVFCGVDCSMVLTLEKKLFCCGSNRFNKLALNDLEVTPAMEEVRSLTMVTLPPLGDLNIKLVAMGTSHSAAITDEGDLYTMGSNQFGQLGQSSKGGDRCHQHPVLTQVCSVACGDTFTVAVTSDGSVYSWGKAARGRLGRSDEHAKTPRKVRFDDEDGFTVVSLSCCQGNTLLATKPTQRSNSDAMD